MMLRNTDNEYIEVEDVEVERQAKLFQAIGDTIGDFSYSFDVDNNSENLSKLGIPSPVDGFMKTIYTANDIDLCDNDGGVLYKGFVRVTGIDDTVIECSFFSGNNNWFNEMSDDLNNLDLSEFEVVKSLSSMLDTSSVTEGIIFPLINTGAFTTRSIPNFYIDDMQPFIYVRDVIKKCFQYSGLKLSGELLNDWRYNHLITSTNRVSPSDKINERTVEVSKVTDETIGTTYQVIDFEVEDSVGDLGIWDNTNYRYVADVKMQVEVTVTITNVGVGAQGINVILSKNGDEITPVGGFSRGANDTFTKNFPNRQHGIIAPIILEIGDYLDIRAKRYGGVAIDITDGNLKITPIRIFLVYPNELLPDASQIDFCLDVFKIFNTVIDYNPFTKTVTVDLFKNAIREDEIDLSEYIDPDSIKINYSELLDSYGKKSNLQYSDPSSEITEKYNSDKIYPYGSGQIESSNDFLSERVDILESMFVATSEDVKNPYGLSIPRVDFTDLEHGSEYTANVTDNAGIARFTTTINIFPVLGELIEIYDSTVDGYLGQYPVETVVAGDQFELTGLVYEANASNVLIRRITVVTKTNGDQLLLLVVNDAAVGNQLAYAYFYKPMISNSYGSGLNDYDKSLSFSPNDIPLAYQRTMIEDYWADLGPILQDPVKVYVDAYLPKPIFDSITFKQPLRIKCDKFNARFFPNRITGYKDSSQPCTLELIKLP